jgi:Uma2 family endonuclease
MGLPAEKRLSAVYADLEAVPAYLVAEIINGELQTLPRPAPKHAKTASFLGGELHGPYHRGLGGPGGWIILDEPEIHLGPDVLVPDLAGWRVERMPELPDAAYFTLPPDWICEVLSPSTEAVDRADKMPIYAREGVRHAWLLDPLLKTLELFALSALSSGRVWTPSGVHRDDARVRAAPFDAIELELALLWAK